MQDLVERAGLPSLAAKSSGETRLVTPILYQASIEAGEAAAEHIARALEETFDPSPIAVGAFELGKGRFEVFAHFAEAPPRDALLALIEHAADGAPHVALRIEQVADEDWVTLSQGKRRPVEAGRFLVYGSHDRARVPHRLLAIEIDAGQAFGTAHHASTRGCLIALDDVLKRSRPRSILDIGTGTGVLAIAAAKALKRPALATDNDPLAVDIARDNARKNGVVSLVRVLKATGFAYEKLRSAAPDLVLANLLERALYELAPAFAHHILRQGRAILSGLNSDQAHGIEARYAAHGFMLEKRIILDGWTTLVIVRRNGQALRD
jgi:ribosomal protein L11 methyltransferase